MTDHTPYVLVRHVTGPGTLHRFPAFEADNLDSVPTKDRIYLNDQAATEMLINGKAHQCSRCFPTDEGTVDVGAESQNDADQD